MVAATSLHVRQSSVYIWLLISHRVQFANQNDDRQVEHVARLRASGGEPGEVRGAWCLWQKAVKSRCQGDGGTLRRTGDSGTYEYSRLTSRPVRAEPDPLLGAQLGLQAGGMQRTSRQGGCNPLLAQCLGLGLAGEGSSLRPP